MSDRDGVRSGIYGMSGTGKSYFSKQLLRSADRVIVFDPEEEYGDEPGFIECTDLKAVFEVMNDCWEGSFKIAFVPPNRVVPPYLPMDGKMRCSPFEWYLHLLSDAIQKKQAPYKAGKFHKKVLFVVDELNKSFGLHVNENQCYGFFDLCSRGRKRGIDILGITQRPAEVNTTYRGNLARVAVFPLSLPSDWTAVSPYVGQDAQERLSGAPEFSHLEWHKGTVTMRPPT